MDTAAVDCLPPEREQAPYVAEQPSWKSTKFWYSIALQIGSTVLLVYKILPADSWVWMTSMIYGGYILGNLGALAIGTNSFNQRR